MEEGTMAKAQEAEADTDVAMPEGLVIRNAEDTETYETNLKKAEYDRGQTEAAPGFMTSLITEAGLEGDYPDAKSVLTAHKTSILKEADKPQDKKIEELESDKTKLQEQSEGWETKFNGLVAQNVKDEEARGQLQTVIAAVPKTAILAPEKVAALFNMEYATVVADGKTIVQKGGVTIKDEKLNEKSVESVMQEFVSANKLVSAGGGAGEGDLGNPGATGSLDAFNEEMKKKNIPMNSEKYNEEMNSRMVAGTLKI